MAAKYKHIATITLDSSASSVTFSSIPQGYRDLELVIDGTGSPGNVVQMYPNGDTTSSNYNQKRMGGNGSTAFSTGGAGAGISNVTTNRGTSVIQVMDYSATDRHKTSISRSSIASDFVLAYVTRWANTSAVTSLQLVPASTDFTSGTTLDLYGIVGGS